MTESYVIKEPNISATMHLSSLVVHAHTSHKPYSWQSCLLDFFLQDQGGGTGPPCPVISASALHILCRCKSCCFGGKYCMLIWGTCNQLVIHWREVAKFTIKRVKHLVLYSLNTEISV